MEFTIDQAAVRLGKTARQVRSMVDRGELPSRRTETRRVFVILDNDTAGSDGQRQAQQHKLDSLRDVVEQTLATVETAGGAKRGYTLEDLRAFQSGRAIYLETTAVLGVDHPAVVQLQLVLSQLAMGCYRFRQDEKRGAYLEARDAACRAAVLYFLAPGHEEAARRIEREILPAIGGLLRRAEKQHRGGNS